METAASKSKTTTKLDFLEDVDAPERIKTRIKQDVGQLLVSRLIEFAAQETSPVKGMKWPALSKEYRKFKQQQGAGTSANLRLNDEMLPELDFRTTEDGIEIGWWGSQAPKADGHANLSGKSRIPTRRLIPDVGQTFKSDILKDIEQIIDSYTAESGDG